MATIWQMICEKVKGKKVNPPIEFQFYNPLNLKKGDFIKIKTVELEDLNFQVLKIRLVDRICGKETFRLIDYDLLAKDLSNNEIKKRIRVTPSADEGFECILFSFVSDFGWDEEYYNSLNSEETAEEPQVDGDGNSLLDANNEEVVDTFWRVNELKEPWNCKTTFLSDKDRDGTIEAEEITTGSLKYWDYWRDTTVHNNKVLEYYIVEMNESKFFSVWRGPKLELSRIEK